MVRVARRLDDRALLQRIRLSRHGLRFAKLWRGDLTGYASASEADLALAGQLAFWCGGDPVRVDRLFRQSALYRPKWDEPHGVGTSGELTIAKAVTRTPRVTTVAVS
jgi:putative DNA primase/helicase